MSLVHRVLSACVVLLGLAPDTAAAPERAGPEHEAHVRLLTGHGPVHVWTPAGYDPQVAATVVYVHGYFANVDDAWSAYRLQEQFRASHLNALFIACEAPTSEREDVAWPSVASLLDTVVEARGPLPEGRVVAIGHSGAHRTLALWLAEPELDTIALLDAAYGDLGAYGTWLDARPGRRLIDVGDLTRAATDAFHESLAETVVVERFPRPASGGLPGALQAARVIYVRSHMGHMPLVTRGIAIPMILRTIAAPVVGNADRLAPLTPR
jgi:hypothetical protein